MSQQQQQHSAGGAENDDIFSIGTSEWANTTDFNGTDLAELKFKMAAFENKVKQLKNEQESVKMAANQREKALQKKLEGSEGKLKELNHEMETLKVDYAKQMKDLEDAERHGQMAEIEMVQKNMEQFAKQLVILEKKAEFGCEHEDSPLCKLVILAATEELEPALEKLAVGSGDSPNSFDDQLKFALDHLSALWTSLCKKTKRLCNPQGNSWSKDKSGAKISPDNFVAKNTADGCWQTAFAKKGFPIANDLIRMNYFTGMIIYYYEITLLEKPSDFFAVGLAAGSENGENHVGEYANSYAAYGNGTYYNCGTNALNYERPSGFIAPELKGNGDVYGCGCGVLQSPQKKLFIFFTANGTLLGKQVEITPTRDYLYPAVSMHTLNTAVEANFGDNPSKPFKYSIVVGECPGLVFEQEHKTSRLSNPQGNHWSKDNSVTKISPDYFVATNTATNGGWQTAFAEKGFPIAEVLGRMNYFSGTIIYYYEITFLEQTSTSFAVGLAGGYANGGNYVGAYANSYAAYGNGGPYRNCGTALNYERSSGFVAPELKGKGDVYGCGVLQSPQKKLFIFFTANGTLLGKQVEITPTRDYLYPAVSMHALNTAVEANFGDNPSKPFKYNIVAGECPGLVFE